METQGQDDRLQTERWLAYRYHQMKIISKIMTQNKITENSLKTVQREYDKKYLSKFEDAKKQVLDKEIQELNRDEDLSESFLNELLEDEKTKNEKEKK